MRKRARQPPPDLTSLFDVLFIVIFAALIRAAAVQQAAAQPPPTPPKPPPQPMDPRSLQARALVDLGKQLAAKPAIVVRVSVAGTITAIEHEGKTMALDSPLLELDPRVKEAYLPDRSAELRVCRVAALHLGAADLSKFLVIVAPEQRLVELDHALADGLSRDIDRCLVDQRGIATIVEP
jgi:hypothetical protein